MPLHAVQDARTSNRLLPAALPVDLTRSKSPEVAPAATAPAITLPVNAASKAATASAADPVVDAEVTANPVRELVDYGVVWCA